MGSGKSALGAMTPNTRDDKRTTSIDLKSYLSYLPNYFSRGIPLAFNMMMGFGLNLAALHFISYYSDARLSAGFGLGNLLYTLFFQAILLINNETMGIFCTHEFGQGNWKGFRLMGYRGLTFNLMVACGNSVLFLVSDKALILAGFEQTLAETACQMAVSMIPALFVTALTNALQTYLVSQKITHPMLYLNLGLFASFVPLGYV
jgi:Na+-driven multidrug efflux pump